MYTEFISYYWVMENQINGMLYIFTYCYWHVGLFDDIKIHGHPNMENGSCLQHGGYMKTIKLLNMTQSFIWYVSTDVDLSNL